MIRSPALSRSCACLIALVLTCSPALAQSDGLGSIRFPTSGSPEAHEAFIRGLAAMHSFWRGEAVESFREAQRLDPDFAMAYWGEALAYDGVWGTGHRAERARDALTRLAPTAEERRAKAPTRREKAYMDAIEVLYGEGERFERARRYAESMRGLVNRFPEDLEAKVLLARAVLATIDAWNFKSEGARLQTGIIAEEVLRENPDHPGAAHYIIHAFDSPERAERALPAARSYARIAPASSHAVHMPSHIYLQLGMWEDAVESNLRAFRISNEYVQNEGLPVTERDYHPLDFLFYAYLQQGRFAAARATLDTVRAAFESEPVWSSWRGRLYYARLGLYAVETGRCDELPDPLPPEGESYPAFFALGWCALRDGDVATAERWHRRLEQSVAAAEEGTTNELRRRITQLELNALIAASRGQADEAESLAFEAVLVRRKLGPQGELPNPILPVHEAYAAVLLELDRPTRAAGQLDYALAEKPNRAMAILGRARASARMGDVEAAVSHYQRLIELWEDADDGLPQLEEARSYLTRHTE